MNELTFQIIILAIPLILTVATFYITKAINVYVDKEMLSNLILNGEIVVQAVEKLWNGIPGDLKKKKAIDLLRKMGIDGTDEQLEAIIEATVQGLTANKIINTNK